MRQICVLGSTGSIGTQGLQLIEKNRNLYRAAVLTCRSNVSLLMEQISNHHPDMVVVGNAEQAQEVQKKFPGLTVLIGEEGLKEAVSSSWDLILNALVGISGLAPTYYGIKTGTPIALANKETLVAGGLLITEMAKEKGVFIIPVDSEHSAIFQCMMGNPEETPRRLILTASGGPFRGKNQEELREVTVEEALCHPRWKMGKKISVDSATMMNKGLEVIEAHWLFDVPWNKIQVLVHPQSIIHSMVEYEDGSILAQLGYPDMKIPIGLSFSYPNRLCAQGPFMDFVKNADSLTFEAVDEKNFTCLSLAREAGKKGGSYPVVLNAANEVLVQRFLEGHISFLDIPKKLSETLDNHQPFQPSGLEEILELDQEVRIRI
jgi:1-deoxy-D-xylulose-5-phosphate reductoisomerase